MNRGWQFQITALNIWLLLASAFYGGQQIFVGSVFVRNLNAQGTQEDSCHRVAAPAQLGSFKRIKFGDDQSTRDIYLTKQGTRVESLIIRCASSTVGNADDPGVSSSVSRLREELLRDKRGGVIDDFSPFFDASDSVATRSETVPGRQLGFAVSSRGNFGVLLFYVFASDGVIVTVRSVLPTRGWQNRGVHEFARDLVRQVEWKSATPPGHHLE